MKKKQAIKPALRSYRRAIEQMEAALERHRRWMRVIQFRAMILAGRPEKQRKPSRSAAARHRLERRKKV